MRLAAELQPERDVVEHPPVGQQAEVLEDHREAPPAQLAKPLLARLPDVLAVQLDRAERRLDEPGQAPDERRLAAAREAHDDEDLARLDVERDVVDRDRAAVLLDGRLDLVRRRGRRAGSPGEALLRGAEDLPQRRTEIEIVGAPGAADGAARPVAGGAATMVTQPPQMRRRR